MRWVLGLMSGTSLDGIDVGTLLTNGLEILERGPHATYAYDPAVQKRIRGVFGAETPTLDILALERDITLAHASAVQDFWQQAPAFQERVALIGFHGQTITHVPPQRQGAAPAPGWTWQLGSGALLAAQLQKPVVFDFRRHDMAHGGQGAPLVPMYHHTLSAPWRGAHGAVLCVNIGGVANATFSEPETFLAFDVGPGGALLDDWILEHTGAPYDVGGAFSLQGQIHPAVLDHWLAHPFFEMPLPKSLDRNAFAHVRQDLKAVSLQDGAATLTAFTVAGILRAMALLPRPPGLVCLMGGGRQNAALVQGLSRALQAMHPATLLRCIEEMPHPLGALSGDSLEAEAFAFLAARRMQGLPISFPTTTGAPLPLPGGVLAFPDGRVEPAPCPIAPHPGGRCPFFSM